MPSHTYSRRDIIRTVSNILVASGAPFMLSCGMRSTQESRPLPERLAGVIGAMRSGAVRQLIAAANLVADVIIGRNRAFAASDNGAFMAMFDSPMTRMPHVFIPLRSEEMAQTIRTGDVIVSFDCCGLVDTARSRGASVILLSSGQESPAPGDVSSAEITIPLFTATENGLDTAASGISAAAAMLALAGEAYERSGGIGRTGESEPSTATAFLTKLQERLTDSLTQDKAVSTAADRIATTVSAGGILYVWDNEGFFSNLFARLKKSRMESAVIEDRGMAPGFTEDDTLVLGALTSNSPDDLAITRRAANAGAFVATICPGSGEGGYRLFSAADVSLDNLSPETGGLIAFDYGRTSFLSTGPIMNMALAGWLAELSESLAATR